MRDLGVINISRCFLLMAILFHVIPNFAQRRVQRGVVRMITHTATDPIVPVKGVQVVVDNVANNASDKNGRFTLNISVNKEGSYSLTDVRVPKGSALILAYPSKKKKLFLDNNDLEVALISKEEKDMVKKANYQTLLEKYKIQTKNVYKLREQLEERQLELDKKSEEYRLVAAKRDSVQKLLNLYYDDKIYEQTLKNIESIAEDLALTDYKSLDSLEANIYGLKMKGDWQTISDVLIRLMGGNASAWLHRKLEHRNQAAKDFAIGMEMIKEAIEAFKMQHLNDSVSKYYDILIKADSTNWDNIASAADFETQFMANYDKADKLYRRMINADADTIKLAGYTGAGLIYIIQKNDYVEGKRYVQKGLDLLISAVGEKNQYVAANYCNLGNIYLTINDYAKAKEYLQKGLDLQIALSGENHENVALAYNGLGGLYLDEGNGTKALEYFNKSLRIRKAIYGEENIYVANILFNIGLSYIRLGENDKALENFEKGLDMRKNLLGENHPDVAAGYANTAQYYTVQGIYDKSLEYLRKALNLLVAAYGESHVNVATCYGNIANVYASQGKYKEALELYNKSLTIKKQLQGEMHTDIASIYSEIAGIYILLNNNTEALKYYLQSAEIKETLLGENHPSLMNEYLCIGNILLTNYAFVDALTYLQKAHPMLEKLLGKDDETVKKSSETIEGLKSIINQIEQNQ